MNLFESDIFTLIYTCLVIGLIVLFFISFTLFIRRVLQSSAAKKHHMINMNQKLDRIIELLEKIRNSDRRGMKRGMRMANYIKELREKVGHDYVFLNFAGGCVFNKEGEVLLQKEETLTLGAFQVVQWR